MSLADYLAQKYLTADPSPSSDRPKKKRKKTKTTEPTSGLIIADDDSALLATNLGLQDPNSDEDAPTIYNSANQSQFRKSKKNAWKTVGAAAPTNAEQDAAEAIIASAAAENTARGGGGPDGDDGPAVVGEDGMDIDQNALRMESGALAGLQTAADTAAMVAAAEKKKAREAASLSGVSRSEGNGETIYRDASGRIINIAMKRAEARKAEDEKRRKEAEAKEAAMGDVQRAQKEKRKQDLQDAKYLSLSRYADDVQMNEELKEQDRWNDPAAEFLTTKKAGRSVTGRPLYQGAAAPNRYGIRPGHKWDGVDRGNGFEKEWFAARNRRSRNERLEYEWQMDE